jgi:hypothetical protein
MRAGGKIAVWRVSTRDIAAGRAEISGAMEVHTRASGPARRNGIMLLQSASEFSPEMYAGDNHFPRRPMTAVSGVVIVRHVDRSIAFGMAKYGNILKYVDSD